MKPLDFLLPGGRRLLAGPAATMSSCLHESADPTAGGSGVTLFLSGDVMTGRGIDQILPHPSHPQLHEGYVHSALDYVRLAERVHGRIVRPAPPDYVWGDALAEWAQLRPAARIVNLETAVTTSEHAWPGKGIHYRMNPQNVACLTAAKLGCCVLANNHVLDWSREGLAETLAALHATGIATAGAGMTAAEAARPAALELAGGGRLLVFAYGTASSGIPQDWAAMPGSAGVNVLTGLSTHHVDAIARSVATHKRNGDLVVLSLHWGENWGFAISAEEQAFARDLVSRAGVDLVHGHSSHHAKGIEVFAGKLILYGCGDLLNDYEGIEGYEGFRGDLALMYFPTLDRPSGRLMDLTLTPTQVRRFRIARAGPEGVDWFEATLNREGRALGTRVERRPEQRLALRWA